MQQIKQPAPPKRAYSMRLTPKLKALPVDPNTGVKLDVNTARCLRAYGIKHGWDIRQQRDGDLIIIWRVG